MTLLLYLFVFLPIFHQSEMYRLYCWLSRSRSAIRQRNPLEIILLQAGAAVTGNKQTEVISENTLLFLTPTQSKEGSGNDFFPAWLIVTWIHTEHNQTQINVTPTFDLCCRRLRGVRSRHIGAFKTPKQTRIPDLQKCAVLQVTFKNNFSVASQLHYVWQRHSLIMPELLENLVSPVCFSYHVLVA